MALTILFQAAFIVFFYMTSVFFIALIKKENSIVDVAWGIGFILIALYSLIKNGLYLPRQLLITTLVLIWGIRISSHIFLRNRGKGEDPRYAKWRKDWGNNVVVRSFLQVFMLQGLVMLIVALPIILVNASQIPGLTIFDALGIATWITGFYFEVVGDYQLFEFIKNPANKGKIMMKGLWKYTRHPNYFGEATMWWGIFFIALSVPYGIVGIISPVLLTLLLLFVSGVPLAEVQFEGNPDYKKYQETTSVFFPLPPKK